MKRFRSAMVLVLLLTLCQIVLVGTTAHADEVIRNGSFDAGLDQWNINPVLPASWNPLSAGAVTLHPASGFNGDVIYQNLNVTGIAGVTLNFSCSLTKISAPDGNTIAVYADYVDNTGTVVPQLLANPSNASIVTSPQTVTGSFAFPATAVRLVKLRVAKENSGQFTIDDISFTGSGITTGSLPVITSLSAANGPYGGQITVTGSGFGNSAGTVTMFGSSSGVAVNSWSNTSVTVTVSDPARSGAVILRTSDKVESNADKRFTVSSPNYTSDLMAQTVQVVKGQKAEFVLKTDFLNGFAPAGGVTFAVSGIPAGGTYSFSPVPQMRSGGVVLKVNTAAVAPGTYNITVQASSAGMITRSVAGKLVVTTTATFDYYQTQSLPTPPYTQTTTLVVSPLTVSAQGYLNLSVVATDSGGMPISDIQLVSSAPSVVGAYKSSYGYYVYAHATGSATLTATAPDGTVKTLTVNVTLPSTPNVVISMNPQTITNKYDGFVDHWITYYEIPGSSISAGGSGSVTYVAGSSNMAFTDTPPRTYGGHFKVDHTLTALGSYLYTGSIFGGAASATNVVPLVITNDPTYAGLNLTIKSLDSSIMSQFFEWFTLEFYDNAGTLLFTRSSSFTLGDTFFIGAINPGNYKLRLVPGGMQVMPQWYPNASNVTEAQAVTFTAGSANDVSLYFFAQPVPDTTAPEIITFDVNGAAPAAATSLTVTGINLYAWDLNGVTGYCLTETNNSGTCTDWTLTPPTQFTFASPGEKTLYAFAKDAAGNISSTTTTSTLGITITVPYGLTLQFAGLGHGTVMGDMTCGTPTCPPKNFDSNTTVTIIASPDADSSFSWTSGCTHVDGITCSVVMTSPTTVILTFTAIPPVKNSRTSITYPTIMGAYGVASDLDSILIRTTLTPIVENLDFKNSPPVTVTLLGGMSSTFTPTSGFSTVKGTMKVSKGKVIVNKVNLKQ